MLELQEPAGIGVGSMGRPPSIKDAGQEHPGVLSCPPLRPDDVCGHAGMLVIRRAQSNHVMPAGAE